MNGLNFYEKLLHSKIQTCQICQWKVLESKGALLKNKYSNKLIKKILNEWLLRRCHAYVKILLNAINVHTKLPYKCNTNVWCAC